MIHAFDENLHPVGLGEHWQESWYFNWADPASDFYGLARIGFRFAQNEIDGLVVAVHAGKPFFAYPALNVAPVRAWNRYGPAEGLGVRRLQFTLLEPLKDWRLQLSGRDNFDLHWQAFTPPYDYGGGPPGVAGSHYEQSGAVRGRARLRGKDFTFQGLGQRDHSWGVRDWAGIRGWTWVSAQFGEDLSFNVWQLAGDPYVGGFVFCDGRHWPAEQAVIELRYGKRKGEPTGARIEVQSGARKFRFEGASRGVFPLAKNGLWMYETCLALTAEAGGKPRAGTGLLEHTFHVGRLGYLPRAGEIAATLGAVFVG
jgi:hypothetical protein